MSKSSYKRILLKLSGEMLMDGQPFGISSGACLEVAKALKAFSEAGIELAIVIGGGNLFRGSNLKQLGMERSPADHMGMLATLINGIALQQSLEQLGVSAKLMSALECPKVAETYTWRGALAHLHAGNIVIFVGGTGNPYFTTDTAAALRASEINADIILKATKVDGVYDRDPMKHPHAIKYDKLDYSQMLEERLEIMDATAISLCRNSDIPIFVFNMQQLKDSSPKEILSCKRGTLVSKDSSHK